MARRKTILDAFKAIEAVEQKNNSFRRTIILTNVVLFSAVGLLIYSTFFV